MDGGQGGPLEFYNSAAHSSQQELPLFSFNNLGNKTQKHSQYGVCGNEGIVMVGIVIHGLTKTIFIEL